MPSGSHRSRGGSHFSGGGSRRSSGSSFSRSSFSSSRSRGSHFGGSSRGSVHVHFGPRRIWLGRRHYYYVGEGNSSPATLGVVLAFFAFFFALFLGIARSSNKADIELIKQDYNYYQDMIDYAKANTEYMVDARVTGKYLNEYAEKYCITYEIDINNSSFPLEGETYAIYTLTETGSYRIGSTIKVAVDNIPVTRTTDSIPMDYEDIPLDRDGEYVKCKKAVTTNTIWMVVCIAIGIGIIALTIRYMYKHSKVEEQKEAPKVEEKESTTITCAYCGGTFEKGKSKCPDCGANLRK